VLFPTVLADDVVVIVDSCVNKKPAHGKSRNAGLYGHQSEYLLTEIFARMRFPWLAGCLPAKYCRHRCPLFDKGKLQMKFIAIIVDCNKQSEYSTSFKISDDHALWSRVPDCLRLSLFKQKRRAVMAATPVCMGQTKII
jgi:hypothetical protein